MVNIIDFQNQDENVVYSKEINTHIKRTSDFFTHLSDKIKEKYLLITAEENLIEFIARIQRKKIFVKIHDTVENNSIRVSFILRSNKLKKICDQLSNKRIFGIKNSFWLLLISIIAIFTALIFIFSKNVFALQVLGIFSVSFAILSVILYFLIVKLSSNTKNTRMDKITELANLIEQLTKNYAREKSTMKICWNCFSETSSQNDICEKCKKVFN